MRRFFLLFLILDLAHCSSPQCPSGSDIIQNGECRCNYTRIDSYSDEAAKIAIGKCQEIHGQPIIIHNEEHQSYWSGRITPGSDHYTVIGLVCNTTSKLWEWADGSAVNYKPPSYNQYLDKDCTEVYSGVSWLMHSDGTWSYFSYSHYPWSTDVFCTIQLSQPVQNAEECFGFEDDSDDRTCYEVGEAAESWQDAQLNCKKLGANLASVHNTNENNFLRRLPVSKGAVHGLFIGATVTGKSGEFGWIDGSEWDYSNYYPGFPRNGFGDCLELETSTSTGQWMNMDCAAQLPVACIRDKRTMVFGNHTCTGETYAEGAIITSPGFPFDASVPCEYFLQVDAGKKVEVEIAFLEANKCCDSLVIYDGYVGGYVLATLSGEVRNATYTTTSSNIMRVQWNPNGGVNVKGMAMMFRGV